MEPVPSGSRRKGNFKTHKENTHQGSHDQQLIILQEPTIETRLKNTDHLKKKDGYHTQDFNYEPFSLENLYI